MCLEAQSLGLGKIAKIILRTGLLKDPSVKNVDGRFPHEVGLCMDDMEGRKTKLMLEALCKANIRERKTTWERENNPGVNSYLRVNFDYMPRIFKEVGIGQRVSAKEALVESI